MSLGIIFGLVAMFGLGLNAAISKYPTQKIGNRQMMVWREIFIVAFLLVPAAFLIPETDISLKWLIITIIFSLTVGYFPLSFFIKALEKGKVGLVVPISNSYVIFTFLLSSLFYGEEINLTKILALVIIISGLFLLSFNPKDLKGSDIFKLSSGLPYALITCLGWGIVFFYFKMPVNYLGPVLTSLVTEAGILVSSYINLKIKKEKLILPSKKVFLALIIGGIFLVIGSISFNLGLKITNQASVMSTINAASPLVAALYGFIVYKERLKSRQWLGVLVLILGIITISL